jgi:hypothetical protein
MYMKKKFNKGIYRVLLFGTIAAFLSLSGCKDDSDDMAPPVITEVRNYAASPNDTVIQTLETSQWIVLTGKNLDNVVMAFIGKTQATINLTLVTSQNLVIQVPAVPFQSVPRDMVNEIMLVDKNGVFTTYSINVTGDPLISYVRNFDAAPNDTLLNAVALGQHINLIGYNLKGATSIAFQGLDIDLTAAIYTDTSVVVTVPADLTGADPLLANKITYTTAVGTSTFSIPIFDPALLAYYGDPLYKLLAGGLNQEKTWVIDMNTTTGASAKFKGPLWWAGSDLGWWDRVCGPGGNCWTYEDTYQSWMAPIRDYGTITFKLKGTPIIPVVTVNQKGLDNASANGVFSGNYFMDVDAKTITFSDVTPLRMTRDQVWSKGYIFSLTEDGLQIGFKDPTKAEYAILNYIPK